MLVDMFKNIPDDVLGIIWEYMSCKQKKLVNKENYENVNQNLYTGNTDSYLRKIIRKDYSYLFKKNIKCHYDKWYKMKKWIYKNMVLSNFIDYLRYLCIENNINNCKKILDNFQKKKGHYRKKKFKNIKTIRTRWNN
jgi:hypothetical protein